MAPPVRRAAAFLRLIRFSHTLFALPWAVAGAFLAARGLPGPRTAILILAAMVAARTAAMTFNRLVDRRFDATNPRTAARPSVTGEVGTGLLAGATLLSSALFIGASFLLNPLAGRLSFAALAVCLGYSLTKRFTALSHFVLGLALGLSPLGAWVAVRGALDRPSVAAALLGAGVLLWTAGFDILYACQDVDHDRREGLRSVPATLGTRGALRLAAAVHALVPPCLWLAGNVADLGAVFRGGVLLVAALLVVEHRLVSERDLSRVNTAFFRVNVAISLLVMTAVIVDLALVAGRPGA